MAKRKDIQTFVMLPEWVRSHPDLGRVDICVYMAIVYYADVISRVSYATHQQIALIARVADKKTRTNSLKRLEDAGAIEIDRLQGYGNRYRLPAKGPSGEKAFTKIPKWVLEHPDLGRVDIAVYAAIASHRNNHDDLSWPGGKRIMAEAHVASTETLTIALKRLQLAGAIVKQKTKRLRANVWYLPQRPLPESLLQHAEKKAEMDRPESFAMPSDQEKQAYVSGLRRGREALIDEEITRAVIKNPPPPRT